MTASANILAKDEVIRLLHRLGYEQRVIDEITSQLRDPVDVERDAVVLARYGLNRGALTDRMGGSP